MGERARNLAIALIVLVCAAGAILIAEGRTAGRRDEIAADFQRLVVGVGFGPALDLSGCAFGFDPRLDGRCADERGPIPAGDCFCPRHAGSVFWYPSLTMAAP